MAVLVFINEMQITVRLYLTATHPYNIFYDFTLNLTHKLVFFIYFLYNTKQINNVIESKCKKFYSKSELIEKVILNL
jgi:hypothetical protein